MTDAIETKRWKFSIADLAFILMFSARLLTFLFVTIIGTKGVFLALGMIALVMGIAMIKRLFFDKDGGVLVFLLLALAILAYTVISLYFQPDLKPWLFGKKTGIVTMIFDVRSSIFGFLVILLLKDPKKIFRNIYLVAWIRFFYCFLQIVLFNVFGNWDYYFTTYSAQIHSVYNMSLGYELAFAAFAFALHAFFHRKKLSFLLSVISSAFAIYFGSRGLLILFLSFYILLFFLEGMMKKKWKKIFKFLLALSVATVALLFIVPFFNRGLYTLARLGGNREINEEEELSIEEISTSRTVSSLEEGTLAESNGRIKIWSLSLKAFLQNPIFGRGMYGDRPSVGSEFRWGYSHNILLEWMAHFGIFGIAFFVLLAYLVLKLFLQKEDSPYYLPALFFMTLSTKLVLSDSFWFNENFWALMAILFLYYRKERAHTFKHLILANVSVFLIFFGFTGVLVAKAVYYQDFKLIEIKEPTVVMNFEKGYASSYALFQEMEKDGNPGTVYLSSSFLNKIDYLSKKQIREMAKKGWSFQDETFHYRGLLALNADQRQEQYELTDAMLNSMKLPQAKALYLPYGTDNMTTKVQLLDFRKMIIKNSFYAPVYKRLTKPQLYELTSYRLNLSRNLPSNNRGWELRKENREEIFRKIDQAYEDKGLIMITIANHPYDKVYFQKVYQYLKDKNFQFKTIKDIYKMGQYKKEDQKTLKNWLMNTQTMNIILN